MRFYTRGKLYRAFPELDGVSDEHCRRLLRRFRPRIRSLRAAGFLICWLILCGGLVAAAAPWVASIENLIFSRLLSQPSSATTPLFLTALAFNGMLIVLPIFCGLLARDLILRMQLRRLLARYGPLRRCRRCGYPLVGHRALAAEARRCPECGQPEEVSLGRIDAPGPSPIRPIRPMMGNHGRAA